MNQFRAQGYMSEGGEVLFIDMVTGQPFLMEEDSEGYRHRTGQANWPLEASYSREHHAGWPGHEGPYQRKPRTPMSHQRYYVNDGGIFEAEPYAFSQRDFRARSSAALHQVGSPPPRPRPRSVESIILDDEDFYQDPEVFGFDDYRRFRSSPPPSPIASAHISEVPSTPGQASLRSLSPQSEQDHDHNYAPEASGSRTPSYLDVPELTHDPFSPNSHREVMQEILLSTPSNGMRTHDMSPPIPSPILSEHLTNIDTSYISADEGATARSRMRASLLMQETREPEPITQHPSPPSISITHLSPSIPRAESPSWFVHYSVMDSRSSAGPSRPSPNDSSTLSHSQTRPFVPKRADQSQNNSATPRLDLHVNDALHNSDIEDHNTMYHDINIMITRCLSEMDDIFERLDSLNDGLSNEMFEQFIELGPQLVNTLKWVQDALAQDTTHLWRLRRHEALDGKHDMLIASLTRNLSKFQAVLERLPRLSSERLSDFLIKLEQYNQKFANLAKKITKSLRQVQMRHTGEQMCAERRAAFRLRAEELARRRAFDDEWRLNKAKRQYLYTQHRLRHELLGRGMSDD